MKTQDNTATLYKSIEALVNNLTSAYNAVKYNEKTYTKKERINGDEYVKTVYKDGVKTSCTTENDVDPEGIWRY